MFIQSQKSNGHKLISVRVGVYGFVVKIISSTVVQENDRARHAKTKHWEQVVFWCFFVSSRFSNRIITGLIHLYFLNAEALHRLGVSQVPVQDRPNNRK
jgi:hypothetical protein